MAYSKQRKPGCKGKKPYRGDKNARPRDEESRSNVSGERDGAYRGTPFNDISWYNANPDLTVAAASLPFPYRPGMLIQIGNSVTTANVSTPVKTSIPGVLALQWIPTVGYSDSPNSPISIAAREIFARVRSQFSGSIEADPPDFVIYLMALDSIFSYIGSLKRIYRLLNSYSPNNYFIPRGLLTSMGMDESQLIELQNNKMDFFGQINQLVGMVDKFICPAVFPVFNRHYWLNDNVYMDSASMNAQFFVFLQEGFYKFQLQTTLDPDVQAGGLTLRLFPPQQKSEPYNTTLFEFGKELIDALSGSDDAYIISGYLMRAYQDAVKFTVDRLGIDEKFEALYVPEVLAQIENSASVGYGADTINVEVYQDPTTNSILCDNTVNIETKAGQVLYYAQPMLSLRNDVPAAADVIEASRLATYINFPAYGQLAPGNVHAVPILSGTEIVTTFNSSYLGVNDANIHTDVLNTVQQMSETDLKKGSRITNFDWFPRQIFFVGNTARLVWDVHNVTSFSLDQMADINKVCLFSEFSSFTNK